MNWYNEDRALLETIHANQFVMLGMLRQILKQEKQVALDFTAATAEIARQTTVDASIEALLVQVVAALAAIPPSNDPATQAALDEVVAGLKANNDGIVASVTANTPHA